MTRVQRGTLAAAILGSSIVFLDGTIVNIALPQIGRELPATLVATLEGQTYVTSGYLATLAALLILAGALGDVYGRKRMFVIGLAGFGITSVLCGIAPTLELLAVARILQGAAGALLVPGSLSIITALFEGPERGRAFGIWAAATSATATLGPPIGGILVEALSWRSAFLVNAPLVAVGLWLALRYMPESRNEDAEGRFDWLGSLVAALAIGGLSFGLVRGQEQRWQDTVAWIAIAVGAVALIAFPILMARRANPLVPLSLFRNRKFAVVNLSTLLIYGALYASGTFQGLFLQNTLGYSPLGAAIVGLPVGIILTLVSTRAGAVAGRIGARPFLVIGPLIMAASMLWWARIPATSTPWTAGVGAGLSPPPGSVFIDVLPAVLLFGIGISLVVAPLTTTLMSSVPVRNAGLGSAINNAISRIGQPLLSAVVFIVVTGTFYATLASLVPGLDPNDPELRMMVQPLNPPDLRAPSSAILYAARVASTDAFHLATIVCAALLAAGATVNWFGLRDEKPSGRTASDALPG
jgi:EmrB/QacA subfamily drug resistance transporter